MIVNKKSFTLVELLLVVAIIGILSAVILISVGSARKKSRDTRRINDLAEIKTAMELYKDATGTYEVKTKAGNLTGYAGNITCLSGGAIPYTGWGWFNCKNSPGTDEHSGGYRTDSIGDGLESWGYFNPEPRETLRVCGATAGPPAMGGYMLWVPQANSTTCTSVPKDKFCVYARLEDPKDTSPADGWDDRSSSHVTGGNTSPWNTQYQVNYRVGDGC